MRKIAHIINPVNLGPPSDLYIAQPITFATMQTAREFARGVVAVDLFSAQYPEDRSYVPAGFQLAPDLERSVLDRCAFDKKRKLPLLADILQRLYEASDAEYFVYTNVDIALMPNFYVTVNALLDRGYDALVINRRSISDEYKHPTEVPLMYAEAGQKHPGHDCFVFRRDALPRLRLAGVCLGVPMIGRVLCWNLVCHAPRYKEFKKAHLTFHLGRPQLGLNRVNAEYAAYNWREAMEVTATLERECGPFNGLSPFDLYPNPLNFDKAYQRKKMKEEALQKCT